MCRRWYVELELVRGTELGSYWKCSATDQSTRQQQLQCKPSMYEDPTRLHINLLSPSPLLLFQSSIQQPSSGAVGAAEVFGHITHISPLLETYFTCAAVLCLYCCCCYRCPSIVVFGVAPLLYLATVLVESLCVPTGRSIAGPLLLSACCCCAIFVSSLFAYLCLHGWSHVSRSDVTWSAFTAFRHDALDTVFSCLLRLSLLIGVIVLSLLYATPDYDTALEEKRREARRHNRRISRGGSHSDGSSGTTAADDDDEQSVSVSINSGSKSEPLLSSSATAVSASLFDSIPLPVAVPVPTELTQTEKHAINQLCSWYRTAGYVFIFILCTAMQVSIGVKVVSFDFPTELAEWPTALFLALPILFINIEQQYCSRLIGKMTREEGQSVSGSRSLH